MTLPRRSTMAPIVVEARSESSPAYTATRTGSFITNSEYALFSSSLSRSILLPPMTKLSFNEYGGVEH